MVTMSRSSPRRSRWRRGLTAAAVLALVAATSPLAAAQERPAAGPQVQIHDFQFTPATVTVPVGTTVTWINRDETLHTVTEADRRFASPGLDPGGVYSYTFANPGRYTYFCSLHPHMTATVIVQ